MITLIHGDDISKSRTDFLKRKEAFSDLSILNGNELDITTLTQHLSNGGFFAENNILFIENLFQKRKDEEAEIFATLLNAYADAQDIFLWEGKEIGKKLSTSLGKHTPVLFKVPQTLFSFLDAIKPGNTKLLLTLYHQALQGSEPEMIFFMLVRQFRLLLAIKIDAEIDETKRMAPWQKGKLIKQAGGFSENQLLTLYEKLYVIECGMKTGGNVLSLSDTIDIFLTEI